MSSEGLSGELHAFLNPLAPLRDTLGMTFDEVKIQIERNITYGIQKLAPVCKFKCRYLENSVLEMPETSLSLFLPPMYAWKSGKVVNSYWNLKYMNFCLGKILRSRRPFFTHFVVYSQISMSRAQNSTPQSPQGQY